MRQRVRNVLVVEDDYLQAEEIGRFIRDTGGDVLGPAGSMEKALPFVSEAHAAVLDIDLSGRLVFPLADMLVAREVPIVFYTGWPGARDLPRRFWHVPLIRKPIHDIRDAAIVVLATQSLGANDDMEAILPKLRVAARLIYRDPVVADRLVERLLLEAINHVRDGRDLGRGDTKLRWLMQRMRRIIERSGAKLMN